MLCQNFNPIPDSLWHWNVSCAGIVSIEMPLDYVNAVPGLLAALQGNSYILPRET